MAGESTYTYDTLKSMDISDPYKDAKYQKELEDAAKNIQRYTTGGPVVGLNRFQQQDIASQALSGEQARREAATEGVTKVSGLIDERLTAAANNLADAKMEQENKQAQLLQQQSQGISEAEYLKEKGLTELGIKKKEFNWELEKNQTNRNDALEDAYVKGIVDNTLKELQISNAMKLQDIDQYYALKKNTINQDFLDWEKKNNTDWANFIAKQTASAQAWAALIEGSLTIADSSIQSIID